MTLFFHSITSCDETSIDSRSVIHLLWLSLFVLVQLRTMLTMHLLFLQSSWQFDTFFLSFPALFIQPSCFAATLTLNTREHGEKEEEPSWIVELLHKLRFP